MCSSDLTFVYTVHADVTDTTGETRSADRGVHVGYTALAAQVTAPEWLTDDKAVPLSISTESLDGEGQKADVVVKIHRLQQPERVARASLLHSPQPGPQPRRRRGPAGPAAKPAPVDQRKRDKEPEYDPANPNTWPLGEVVFDRGVTTDGAGKSQVDAKLGPGIYRVVLETQDRFGKKVTAKLPLRVIQPEAKKLDIRIADMLVAPQWSIEPGTEFVALWGSGYDRARAFIEIEHRGRIIRALWTDPAVTQQKIQLPVEESHRGGFTLRVTMVRENRGYLNTRRIEVPWTNKKIGRAHV